MSGLHFGLTPPPGRAVPRGRLPGNAHVFALGDSRTLDNFRSGTISIEGPLTWTRQRSLGRMDFGKADNLGIGGATTSDLLASQLPTALASAARTLVLMAGTNDCRTSITPATSIANLEAMINAWVGSAADRVVIVADEAPWAEGVGGNRDQLAAIRDHIRAHHSPRDGVYVWPVWNTVATTPDGTTPRAASYRDGLHWGKSGAARAGAALWSVLDTLLPKSDLLARPGLIAGGDLVPNAQGTAPVGWTVPALAGVETRMETDTTGTWLVVEMDAVSSLNLLLYTSGDIPAGVVPGAATLDSHMLYAIDQGSENLSRVTMELWAQSGQRLLTASGERASDGNDMGSSSEATNGPLPGDAMVGMLRPPPAVLPSGATQLRPWAITLRGLPGLAASGTVRFSMPQLRLWS